jgi:hypothetical protein
MTNSLWIDPDDSVEVTLDGTSVRQINDKSSAGNSVLGAGDGELLLLPRVSSPNNVWTSQDKNQWPVTFVGDVTILQPSPNSPLGIGVFSFATGSPIAAYAELPSAAEFGYGTGDFTIEFYMYANSIPTTVGLFDQRPNGTAVAVRPTIYLNSTTLTYYVNGAARITGAGLSTGTWYHIAVCRSSGTTRMFIDGVQTGSSYTDSNNYPADWIRLGNVSDVITLAPLDGYMTGVRVLKGTALYTTTFTPPTTIADAPQLDTVLWTDKSPGDSILDTSNGGFLASENRSPNLVNMDGPDFTAIVAIRDYPSTSPIDWSESVIFGMDGVASPLDETGWRIKTVGPSPEEYRIEGSVGDAATNFVTLRAPSSPETTFETLGDGIMTLRYSSAQSSLIGYVNGVEMGAVTYTGTLGFGQPLKIGENFTLGRIYEVLYYDSALNIDDIQRAEGFIAHKWGMQDILPTTHPFRVVGPDKEVTAQYIANCEAIDTTASPPGYTLETGQEFTFLGNAAIDSSQSALGYSSIRFDGTGDLVTLPDSTDHEFGSGDFTIEFWVRWAVDPGTANVTLAAKWISTGSQRSFAFNLVANVLRWNWSVTGVLEGNFVDSTGSFNPAADQWYHIAVCRYNSFIYFFVDGVQNGSPVANSAVPFAGTATLDFGGLQEGGFTQMLNGWMDGIRVVKGTALYKRNFTPPRRLLKNPSSAVLLCNFDGVDAAASPPGYTSEDTGARSASFFGNAQLDTAIKQAGTGSLLLDGTGDYVSFPDSVDFDFGSGDFTMEGWFRFDTNSTADTLIARWNSNGVSQRAFLWRYRGDLAPDRLQFVWSTDGTAFSESDTGAWTPTIGQWYHLAVCRQGSKINFWIDGALDAGDTDINTDTIFDVAEVLDIGSAQESSGYTNAFDGNIDSIRIVKGTALYGAVRPLDRPFIADDVHPDDRLVADFEAANGISSPPGYTAITGQEFQWQGTAAISTTERRVGSSSLSTPGGADGILLQPRSPDDLVIGTQDFAIEYWFRTTTPTADQVHWDQRSTTTQVAPALYVASVGGVMKYYVNGADVIAATTAPGTNEWMHVCLERNSGATRLYINGVQEGSTYTDSNNYVANPIYIGKRFTSTQGLTGYMDQVRYRIGSVIYGSDFTPPPRFGEPIIEGHSF